jgi:hypothetical protein
MSTKADAIRGALNILGNKTGNTATVRTAGAKSALDLLADSTLDELIENQVNLREVAVKLFNWGPEPKATKNVIRALNTALNTPGKYSHAVEVTGYISALSPLLQPDRLVRLFSLVNEVETAFAPNRYTLQLSHKMSRLLSRYPEDRREKLAHSLWVESHTGRWWDLTAGDNVFNNQEQPAALKPAEAKKRFINRTLTWSPDAAAKLSTMLRDKEIIEALDEYNDDLAHELPVDPDTAVLASNLPWLTPVERPESPIGSLLDTVQTLVKELDYELPEKPKKFSELFPNIRMYGGKQFPFPASVYMRDNVVLVPGVVGSIIQDSVRLAENRDYMGNCTWSYKDRMEAGSYVLYRITAQNGDIYNASMNLRNGKWSVSEVNSRFNRSNVPQIVHTAFAEFVKSLPVVDPRETQERIEVYKKLSKMAEADYKFAVV